ncbi:unnamed protein product, partial [Ectocarpus sp. 12 AP-2014]
TGGYNHHWCPAAGAARDQRVWGWWCPGHGGLPRAELGHVRARARDRDVPGERLRRRQRQQGQILLRQAGTRRWAGGPADPRAPGRGFTAVPPIPRRLDGQARRRRHYGSSQLEGLQTTQAVGPHAEYTHRDEKTDR